MFPHENEPRHSRLSVFHSACLSAPRAILTDGLQLRVGLNRRQDVPVHAKSCHGYLSRPTSPCVNNIDIPRSIFSRHTDTHSLSLVPLMPLVEPDCAQIATQLICSYALGTDEGLSCPSSRECAPERTRLGQQRMPISWEVCSRLAIYP